MGTLIVLFSSVDQAEIPLVAEMAADHTGLAPKMDIDPSRAIAYGAALASVS